MILKSLFVKHVLCVLIHIIYIIDISPLYWNLPNKYGYDEENDVIAEIPSLNVTITSKNISWIYESTGIIYIY